MVFFSRFYGIILTAAYIHESKVSSKIVKFWTRIFEKKKTTTLIVFRGNEYQEMSYFKTKYFAFKVLLFYWKLYFAYIYVFLKTLCYFFLLTIRDWEKKYNIKIKILNLNGT